MKIYTKVEQKEEAIFFYLFCCHCYCLFLFLFVFVQWCSAMSMPAFMLVCSLRIVGQ